MKILVTGVGGQLGYDVIRTLEQRGIETVGSDILPVYDKCATYISLDITQEEQVYAVLNAIKPDAVIHCAAWTAVDAAEDEDNQATVRRINVSGTTYVARACKALGCKMMYLSTDYVFDGTGDTPWLPDYKGYSPLNVYGESKLAGELAVAETLDKYFIVRIAWVFGINGNNFVKTMLKLAEKYNNLRVVNDQIGTPTYTYDLARLLADMIVTDKYGYYHATNEGGFISWYDFAEAIFAEAGVRVQVTPVTTAEYGLSKAKRPFNSRLDKHKLIENGFEPLPSWQDALSRYMKEIAHGKN